MKPFCVRAATDADIPALVELEKLCFTDPWSELSFRSQINSSNIFTVAVDIDGNLLGFSAVSLIPPESELLNIAVHPEYRGTGVADVLLTRPLDRAKEHGVDTVYLEVRASNERAKRFYEKFGFDAIGLRKNYYDNPKEDAILMSLAL